MAELTPEQRARLRRVRRVSGAVFALLAAFVALHFLGPRRVTVFVAGEPVSCNLARTDATRERGLQGYASLPSGQGMLFVNDAPEPTAIETKAIRFPVDVAFVDGDLRIVKVAMLDPGAPREVSTAMSARYVLEVPAGWLAANDIGVGSELGFIGAAP